MINHINFQVKILDLAYNNFNTISSTLSQYLNLEILNLRHNKISAIEKNDLNKLRSLRELDLSRNYLRSWSINQQSVAYLKSLEILDLSGNRLEDASKLRLSIDSLTTLKLRNCSLNGISGGFLKGFPNLTELDLSYNQVEVINRLPPLSKLNVLNLSHNAIFYISDGAFLTLTSLSKLVLSHNYNLRNLSITAGSLTELRAVSCGLEHVTLNNASLLTTLLMSGNSLKKVPILKSPTLTHFDLSNNKIVYVNNNAFRELEWLSFLNLSVNTIPTVSYNTFKTNFRLITLDLSNNYINEVARFSSDSLQTLNLSNCEITALKNDSLSRMPFLSTLILSKNHLSKLPNKLFSDHLQTLDLTFCRIASLNNSTFAAMPHLHTLSLVGNRLSTNIQPSFFHDIDRVYLEDNAWRCDCSSKSFREMYDWLENKQMPNDLTCQFPDTVEGKTWLEACYSEWYPIHDRTGVLLYCITVFIFLAVMFCIFLTVRRTTRLKEEREREEERERREQAAQRILDERMEEERALAFQNAPDPREAQRPPSYTEALLMPKLDGSMGSLYGSRPSISGSRKSVNSTVSKTKVRRKRRRKSRIMESQRSASRENVDTDTESDLNVPYMYKESSI